MNLLIKKAKIYAAHSKYDGKVMDILVKKGKIIEIARNIESKGAKELKESGLCISVGWCDIGVQIGDPGHEHRETIASATQAAMAGGYTSMAVFPNSNPVVDKKSAILYLKNTAAQLGVELLPIGAVSDHCDGKEITEMYDMASAGAVAFSDGLKSIQDGGLMMRALQYVKGVDSLIINNPNDKTIAGSGQLHEGVISTSMGMKGIPSIAEELMIQRDLYLAEYTDSKLHIQNVSTAGAVDLIKKAKSKGLKVTASVAAINLVYTDEDMSGFDTNLKVHPPLRSTKDQKALLKGLKDGTIDCINTNHIPLDTESKDLEFPYATKGVIGLETTFAVANTYAKLPLEDLINNLTVKSRSILNLDIPALEAGAPANLTIFNPTTEWTFEKADIRSKSHNTPFIGTSFTGKVLGIINAEISSF